MCVILWGEDDDDGSVAENSDSDFLYRIGRTVNVTHGVAGSNRSQGSNEPPKKEPKKRRTELPGRWPPSFFKHKRYARLHWKPNNNSVYMTHKFYLSAFQNYFLQIF